MPNEIDPKLAEIKLLLDRLEKSVDTLSKAVDTLGEISDEEIASGDLNPETDRLLEILTQGLGNIPTLH